MSHYFPTSGNLLGVDVGNTKTHALITDISGSVVGLGKAGCANHEVIGIEGFAAELTAAVEDALHSAGLVTADISAMGFGIAGYDWPSQVPIMETAIQSLGINCPYLYVNDAVIGLIAGSSEGWGVAVDAGTGNNVRGRDQHGKEGRITGNSIRFGEIGGAGELVWRAMVAVTYAWTKRGPKTRLTQLMMEFAEVESEDALIEALATDQVDLSPSLAIEVFSLAAAGDPVAQEVVQESAHELAENTVAVIRQLAFQKRNFEIVLIGSVFKAGELYIQPFRERIHQFAPHAHLINLKVPPVVGAVLLAAEAAGLGPASLRQHLLEATKLAFPEISE